MQPLLPRIRRGYDGAHGFLIESLEPTVALKIFQMAANCPITNELLTLLARNQSGGGESFSPLATHGPAFAFGECLPQKFKIGERLHQIHTL